MSLAADYQDNKHNVCEGTYTTAGCSEWGTHVTGENNVALGDAMMPALTSGFGNVALDFGALKSDTEGNNNIASGLDALQSNTTGDLNLASGFRALERNTIGGYNVASGPEALHSNTEGTANIASGFDALGGNTTGDHNVATGFETLFRNETGNFNIASGIEALAGNITGSNNIASGFDAMNNNIEGNENIALGRLAGTHLTTGSNNIEISNEGTEGEKGTTRIGTKGKQTRTFIAGISGKTLAGTTCVVDVNTEGQLGCTTGTPGPVAASFEFSTGGTNLGNNKFVGLGGVNGNEGVVQQSVAPSGTLTKMTCFQNGTASAAVTYTLRDNSASTTLTCTIPTGSTKGVGTGSVTFASGDLLDVKTPASGTPGKPGSFSVSTG